LPGPLAQAGQKMLKNHGEVYSCWKVVSCVC
jgi:hypothetical protein